MFPESHSRYQQWPIGLDIFFSVLPLESTALSHASAGFHSASCCEDGHTKPYQRATPLKVHG